MRVKLKQAIPLTYGLRVPRKDTGLLQLSAFYSSMSTFSITCQVQYPRAQKLKDDTNLYRTGPRKLTRAARPDTVKQQLHNLTNCLILYTKP